VHQPIELSSEGAGLTERLLLDNRDSLESQGYPHEKRTVFISQEQRNGVLGGAAPGSRRERISSRCTQPLSTCFAHLFKIRAYRRSGGGAELIGHLHRGGGGTGRGGERGPRGEGKSWSGGHTRRRAASPSGPRLSQSSRQGKKSDNAVEALPRSGRETACVLP